MFTEENSNLNQYGEEKIEREGQACRHCGHPVVRKEHRLGWRPKKGQPYYFKWWLKCTNGKCQAVYMTDSAKEFLMRPPENLSLELRQRLEREP